MISNPIISAIMAAGLIFAAPPPAAFAQSAGGIPVTMTTARSLAAWLPAGYREAGRRSVSVDGAAAELIRHERADGRNAGLGGEHFSALIAADGRLKGFARIDLDLVGQALPSQEEAEALAMDFLRREAPDLLPGLRLSWIAPHDEPIRLAQGGASETLTGMKVKMRNTADGLWFWAIVGADRQVMIFERDIRWINFPGHRATEQWLHDSWLAGQGQGPVAG